MSTTTKEGLVIKNGIDALDLELLQKTLGLPSLRNPSLNFWEFVIENDKNGTRLIVGISRGFQGLVYLHIDLVTKDCPPLNEGKHQPHQHLAGIGAEGINRIEYHLVAGFVDFWFTRTPEQNAKNVRIFREGYFFANTS